MKTKILVVNLLLGSLLGLLPASALEVGDVVQADGVVQLIWGDPPPGSGLPDVHHYELITPRGERWLLDLGEELIAEAGGLLALSEARAQVTGRVAAAALPKLTVTRLVRQDPEVPPDRSVTGSLRYIWILMRFADNPDTPQPTSFFMDQALGDYPSVDHFYRELSYNNINLAGSTILGWFDLPHPRSYYVYDIDPEDPDDEVDGQRTLADAIALADPYVDFTDYHGFHMCYNDVLDCCSYGGQAWLTIDGETRYWAVTWLADWGWGNQDVICHETGHSIGWPHSSGDYGDIYDSRWDVMSLACGECNWTDPVYGNLGVHTITYHKDLAGWIHPLHQYEPPSYPEVRTIWLNGTEFVPPAGRLLMARSRNPGDPSRYLTFERRKIWGYDQNLPDAAVIIHSVDPTRDEPAHVYDSDYNGDCNDEGARWDVGETFASYSYDLVVTVEDADANGSLVTFANSPLATVYVAGDHTGFEDGTASYPWNTLHEGYGSTYPAGQVSIQPGSYTAPYSLRKSTTLRRWGSTGVVSIGH